MNDPQSTVTCFIFEQSNFRTILIFGRLIFGEKSSDQKLKSPENKYFMALEKVSSTVL